MARDASPPDAPLVKVICTRGAELLAERARRHAIKFGTDILLGGATQSVLFAEFRQLAHGIAARTRKHDLPAGVVASS
jgi:hypothetical protein